MHLLFEDVWSSGLHVWEGGQTTPFHNVPGPCGCSKMVAASETLSCGPETEWSILLP